MRLVFCLSVHCGTVVIIDAHEVERIVVDLRSMFPALLLLIVLVKLTANVCGMAVSSVPSVSYH